MGRSSVDWKKNCTSTQKRVQEVDKNTIDLSVFFPYLAKFLKD